VMNRAYKSQLEYPRHKQAVNRSAVLFVTLLSHGPLCGRATSVSATHEQLAWQDSSSSDVIEWAELTTHLSQHNQMGNVCGSCDCVAHVPKLTERTGSRPRWVKPSHLRPFRSATNSSASAANRPCLWKRRFLGWVHTCMVTA